MKRPFFFLTVIVFVTFLGCTQSGQKFQDNAQDSVTLNYKKDDKKSLQTDSITKTEQEKAIGDIHFYISEKEFNKEKKLFIKKCELPESEFYKNVTVIYNKIGGYGFNNINGLFYKDSLYYIELTGCLIEYDDYNIGMPDQYNALIDLLKSKYGAPQTDNGFPNWTSIEKGYFMRCAIWEIGDKSIEVRISCDGTHYTLDLAVFKPDIDNLIKDESETKAKEETKKGTSVL